MKCICLGIATNKKRYILYNKEQNKIFHSRDVHFDEKIEHTRQRRQSTLETRVSWVEFSEDEEDIKTRDKPRQSTQIKNNNRDKHQSSTPTIVDVSQDIPNTPSPSSNTESKQSDHHDHTESDSSSSDDGMSYDFASTPPENPTQVHPRTSPQPTNTRPQRNRAPIKRFADDADLSSLTCFTNTDPNHQLAPHIRIWLAHTAASGDPQSYAQAISSPACAEWIQAIILEFQSLKMHGTWEICELPPDRKAIKSKWVFVVKSDENGIVTRHKARLCAKGFTQREGIDYKETFAPVIRIDTVRVALAIAAQNHMHAYQLDVETAFLNGILEEEIYMEIPKGFKDYYPGNKPTGRNTVLKLIKSLYGTKQAGLMWNKNLHRTLTNLKFKRSPHDHCLYTRGSGQSLFLALIWVDDIIIICSTKADHDNFRDALSKHYKIRDLGKLKWCLGLHFNRDEETGGYSIHQEQYINTLLKAFNMSDCAPVNTPATTTTLIKEWLFMVNNRCGGKKADKNCWLNVVHSLTM